MNSSTTNLLKAFAIATLGVVIATGGIHVGETDDAPGAALLGIVIMLGLMAWAVKLARRKT